MGIFDICLCIHFLASAAIKEQQLPVAVCKHTQLVRQIAGNHYDKSRSSPRPIRYDPGPWDPASGKWKKFYVQDHWAEEAHVFEPELKRWTAFRNYQQHIRKDPEKFPAYRQYIRQYREENALESPVQLHLQAEQQTKLDEWKEYQVIQHRKLAKKQRKLRKTQREVELAHEGLEAADSDNLRVGDRRSDTHIPRQGGRR